MWLWRGWVGYSCHMGQLALLADNLTLWTLDNWDKKNLEIGLTSPALTSHKKVFVIFSRAVHALHFRVLAARTCPISGFQSIFCNLPQRQILALCFSISAKSGDSVLKVSDINEMCQKGDLGVMNCQPSPSSVTWIVPVESLALESLVYDKINLYRKSPYQILLR